MSDTRAVPVELLVELRDLLQDAAHRMKAKNERLQATCDGLDAQNDAIAAENERLAAMLNQVTDEGIMLTDVRDTLRKQLDEADEVLGRKNARIAEFAERHLKDFVELERLDKQLDEARRLLKAYGGGVSEIDAWLEANK